MPHIFIAEVLRTPLKPAYPGLQINRSGMGATCMLRPCAYACHMARFMSKQHN